ncbi:MAG TPA: class I SAM-dependent methyltransferase, partial [Ktedonobacteraceae bacterium]|nr:class I SAM-dependent methyltransferase [Ktedonobacteraceae bacterium]
MRPSYTSWRRLTAILAGLLGFLVICQIILRLRSKLYPKPIPFRLAPVLRASSRRWLFGSPEKIVER